MRSQNAKVRRNEFMPYSSRECLAEGRAVWDSRTKGGTSSDAVHRAAPLAKGRKGGSNPPAAPFMKALTVTFFFPEPGVRRGSSFFHAYNRGFGKLMTLRQGMIVKPRAREIWRTKQKNYLIRELTITSL
jgi:hypothetical protein